MRYTVLFKRGCENMDAVLQRLEAMGAHVTSVQRFIGTAVIEASPEQAERVRQLADVAAITASRTTSIRQG